MFGMTPQTTVRRFSAAAAVAALLTLSACGSDESSTATTAAADTTSAPVTALTLTSPWARTSPAATTMGAAYVTITSPIDDALLAVQVDAGIAADGAQLHEMAMSGTEMSMQPVDRIELPAGEAVALAPGGYHIMLMGLVTPLEVGTTIQLGFVFEQAGLVTIDVPVLDEAPMP